MRRVVGALVCLVAVAFLPLLALARVRSLGTSASLVDRAVLHARIIAVPGTLNQDWRKGGKPCDTAPIPINLATTAYAYSAFSAPLRPSANGSNEVRVVLPQNKYSTVARDKKAACTPLEPRAFDNAPWFDNAILAKIDGSCPLSMRVYHASLVGIRIFIVFGNDASALIRSKSTQPWPTYRYGNSTDPNLNVTEWLEAQPPGEGYGFASPYPEPSVIDVGQMESVDLVGTICSLYELTSCGGVVKLAFTLPGSMVLSERLALRDLASALVMPSSIDLVTAGYGTLLPLSALIDAPSSADPCTMGLAGVWCEDGHLVSLYLANLQMSGELPSSFASFTQLRALQMPNNHLSGTLSPSLGDLPLVIVDVSINLLTGIADCFCGNRTDVTQLSEVAVPEAMSFLDSITSDRIDPNPYEAPNATNGYPLLVFNASVNDIRNLPVSLLGCGNLRRLRLSQNRMASPPLPDLVARNWPALQEINLEQAGITGQVPTFKGLGNLETLIISRNSFTGNLRRDIFDDLKVSGLSLEAADLGRISGDFPNFAVTKPLNARVGGQLTSVMGINRLDLSGNNLRGVFETPMGLESLLIGGNRVLPPYDFRSENLQILNLTDAGLSCQGFEDLTGLLLNLTRHTRIRELHLAANELNCTWDLDRWMAVSAPRVPVLADLAILNLSGNSLHGQIPPSLLRTDASQPWEVIDLSSNNWSGELPPLETPIASLRHIDVRHNPSLRRAVNSTRRELFYADTASPDRISTDCMLCPQLKYAGGTYTTILLDYSYTDYEGCECGRGYFGVAPDCTNVPSATSWDYQLGHQVTSFITLQPFQANRSSTSNMVTSELAALPGLVSSQSFTDGYYGGQRFSAGMTTTFTMQSASSEAARVLMVTLYLNPQAFDSYTDLLSIYEGGDDLKGVRVFSVHGSDFAASSFITGLSYASSYESDARIPIRTLDSGSIDSAALLASVVSNAPTGGQAYLASQWSSMEQMYILSIPIFAPSATLQFQSLDTSGVHFVATYVTSASCPDGLEPDSTFGSTKCLSVVTATSSMRTVVFVVAACSLAASLWSFLGVIRFRDHDIIRGASTWCLLLMSGFMLALSCGSMTFAVLPEVGSSSVCDLRVWLTSVPLAGILAVLLAKSNRVVTIFTAKYLRRRTVTDGEVAVYVAVLMVLQLAMCAAFSGWELSQARLVPAFGNGTSILILQCTREYGFYRWLSLEVICCGLMTLWAGVLAFRTRDVISAFNESVHLANSICALIFIAATAVPVSILVADQQDATVLLQGLSVALLVIVWNITLFAPKFYYISTGRAFQAVAQVPRRLDRPKHAAVAHESDVIVPDEAPVQQPSGQPFSAKRFSIIEPSNLRLDGGLRRDPFLAIDLHSDIDPATSNYSPLVHGGAHFNKYFLPSVLHPPPQQSPLVLNSHLEISASSPVGPLPPHPSIADDFALDCITRVQPVMVGEPHLSSLLPESTSGESSGDRQGETPPTHAWDSQQASRPLPTPSPRDHPSAITPTQIQLQDDGVVDQESALQHFRFLPGQPHSQLSQF